MSKLGMRSALLLLLAIGSLAHLVLIRIYPIGNRERLQQRGGDEQFYVKIADSLASRGTFTETHLKAYRPPGFPACLALGFVVLGSELGTVQVVQNLLFLVAAALLASTAGRRLGALTGLICLALLITNPTWLMLPQRALSEPLFVALLALGLHLQLRLHESREWPLALLDGAVMGLSALVREISLYFGLFLAYRAWRAGRRGVDGRKGRCLAFTVVAGMMLAILPWTAKLLGFRAASPHHDEQHNQPLHGEQPRRDGEV